MKDKQFRPVLDLHLEHVHFLRYGENPHQVAALYRDPSEPLSGLLAAKFLQGKEMSYNNYLDADAALAAVSDFTNTAAVIVKHTNPCGVAMRPASSPEEAFRCARDADPVSAFGSVVAINRAIDGRCAEAIAEGFVEVLLAPEYSEEALEVFKPKKALRVLVVPGLADRCPRLRSIAGGYLLQSPDVNSLDMDNLKAQIQVVTKSEPTEAEWMNLAFAWIVVKHVKSNAIVVADWLKTLGVGAGQMSRVESVKIAVQKAGKEAEGAVLAGDAFFPFKDGVEVACKAGIRAIIQPGGSKRDQESIDTANEYGVAMVFTGFRHFRH